MRMAACPTRSLPRNAIAWLAGLLHRKTKLHPLGTLRWSAPDRIDPFATPYGDVRYLAHCRHPLRVFARAKSPPRQKFKLGHDPSIAVFRSTVFGRSVTRPKSGISA